MDLNEYQEKAAKFNNGPMINGNDSPSSTDSIVYLVLGLCGEAGEVSEKVKKIWRNKQGLITHKDTEEITKELGDVLWYISACAQRLHVTLEQVATTNIDKLTSRLERGVIHGEGDNR